MFNSCFFYQYVLFPLQFCIQGHAQILSCIGVGYSVLINWNGNRNYFFVVKINMGQTTLYSALFANVWSIRGFCLQLFVIYGKCSFVNILINCKTCRIICKCSNCGVFIIGNIISIEKIECRPQDASLWYSSQYFFLSQGVHNHDELESVSSI